MQPNRAQVLAKQLGLTVTLKRVPPVASIEHADDARFALFTKLLWRPIYENQQGYTVLLVPSYFDYVKLKGYLTEKNQNVAMISEYTERRECQRLRTAFEMKDCNILMITERALVFQKIRLRFARNLVLYSLPESPDIIDDTFSEILDNQSAWDTIVKHRLTRLKQEASSSKKEEGRKQLTQEQLAEECKKVLAENKASHRQRSIVGLFTKFDGLVLERMVGTANFKTLLTQDSRDAFNFS